MTIEKISVNGHYVWVDKDVEISGFENDIWVYKDGRVWLWQNTMALISNNKPIKVIAASPELNLEGVSSYVDYLYEKLTESDFDEKYEDTPHYYSFVEGYQTAEKELFTEDDVKRVVELIVTWESMEIKTTTSLEKATEEIIEQIKQEKK